MWLIKIISRNSAHHFFRRWVHVAEYSIWIQNRTDFRLSSDYSSNSSLVFTTMPFQIFLSMREVRLLVGSRKFIIRDKLTLKVVFMNCDRCDAIRLAFPDEVFVFSIILEVIVSWIVFLLLLWVCVYRRFYYLWIHWY